MKQALCITTQMMTLLILATICRAQPLLIVHHDAFDSYYDIATRNPACVTWILEPADFAGNYKPSTRHFKVDTQLPPPRVTDKDFRGSGYVRGHLCPAADRDSNKKLLKQTYLTSNVCPMTMNCNSGSWKILEDSCRALALSHGKLLIAAGPIFISCCTSIHSNTKLIVPDGFYRIAKCLVHSGECWFWYVPNTFALSRPVRLDRAQLEKVLPTAVRTTGLLNYLNID
jgi:endonuclease G